MSGTTDKSVTLAEVTVVTEGTPVLVNGAKGDYEMEETDEEDLEFNDVELDSNQLKVVAKGESVESAYVLANKDNKVAFYFYNGNGLPEGRVYLPVESGNARQMLTIGDSEATGISEELIVKSEGFAPAAIYDMLGRRVAQPQRGLYIMGGKKLIVK